jgi:hypothetical protein
MTIAPVKTLVHKSLRLFGFDILSISNLEREIERRVQERQQERFRQIEELRKQQQTAKGAQGAGVFWLSRQELFPEAIKRMISGGTVLDIGCAFRPQHIIGADIHICCEPFAEYMDRLLVETKDNPKYVYVAADLTKVSEVFPPASVDTAILVDVIEHVDPEPARIAIKKLQQIVRRQLLMFTPLGFTEQDAETNEKDPWGMGGVEWQRHRSGWTPEDFPAEQGWTVFACKDFHQEDGYGRKLEKPDGALWAIWDRNLGIS